MQKLIIFVVIVVVLLFAGKLGLEYYYGKKLDQAISIASYVADVDYQNVRIGTDGSISINNLSVRPHAVDTFVQMDTITLFSSDRLLPINLASFIKRSEFPEELGVRIKNMEYDPSVLEPAINENAKCRYIETTLSPQLSGINRLNANIEASMQVNSGSGVLSLSSSDQTAEMSLQANFDASMLNQTRSASNSQPFDEVTVEYKLDEQVANNIIETCAEHLAISTDEYLNNVVGNPNFLRTAGVDFGTEAHQAMIDMMQGDTWLSIRSKPSSQLNSLKSLSFYPAKDMVRLLGLKVSVDSNEIVLNVSELTQNNIATGADANGDPNQETVAQAPTLSSAQIKALNELSPEDQERIRRKLEDSTQSNASQYSFQATPMSNLRRYLNYSVIFDRRGDMKQMSGELIAIEGNIFTIETSQYGGKAKFEISAKDVVEVQVYR